MDICKRVINNEISGKYFTFVDLCVIMNNKYRDSMNKYRIYVKIKKQILLIDNILHRYKPITDNLIAAYEVLILAVPMNKAVEWRLSCTKDFLHLNL